MTARRADVRREARRDVRTHIVWLRQEAGADVANKFARSTIATFAKLAEAPMIGPAAPSRDPRLSGLRKWPVQRFPKLLIFYRPADHGVEIMRVLHAAQDWWSLLDAD